MGTKAQKGPAGPPSQRSLDQGKESSLISTASVHEERKVPPYPITELVLVRCFRHEGEGCPRCAGCGEPAGQPSRGGKTLIGLRNFHGRDQPFYCLGCHPELGRGPVMLEGEGE